MPGERGLIFGLRGDIPWRAWTPIVDVWNTPFFGVTPVAPALSLTSGGFSNGRYKRIGDTVIAQFEFYMGSSGSGGAGPMILKLPVPIRPSGDWPIGTALIYPGILSGYTGGQLMQIGTSDFPALSHAGDKTRWVQFFPQFGEQSGSGTVAQSANSAAITFPKAMPWGSPLTTDIWINWTTIAASGNAPRQWGVTAVANTGFTLSTSLADTAAGLTFDWQLFTRQGCLLLMSGMPYALDNAFVRGEITYEAREK